MVSALVGVVALGLGVVQATHLVASCLLVSRHVSHFQDPGAGLNNMAREEAAGAAVVVLAGGCCSTGMEVLLVLLLCEEVMGSCSGLRKNGLKWCSYKFFPSIEEW